jgi:polyhydroxybutyrate depolymerase
MYQKYLFALLLFVASFITKAQILDDSLLIEGHRRSFHFLKSPKTKASLVFVLHGSGGNGIPKKRPRSAVSSCAALRCSMA